MLDVVERYARKVRKAGLPISELAIRKAFPELSRFTVGRVLEFLLEGRADFSKVIPEPPKRKSKITCSISKEHLGDFYFCVKRQQWIEKRKVRGVTYSFQTKKWRCYSGKYLGEFPSKQQAVARINECQSQQRNVRN